MDYRFELFIEVKEFLSELPQKHKDKIGHALYLLAERSGIIDEPYSKHIRGKIRELRVDFGRARYRLLYALLPDKIIIVLAAFRKSTAKTPENIIKKAEVILDSYQK